MTQNGNGMVVPGAEVRGKVRNMNVEIVIRNADGTVKEKRIETIPRTKVD